MTDRYRAIAWECAYVLAQDFADRLPPEQHVIAVVNDLRGPERADLECIALACHVIRPRQ